MMKEDFRDVNHLVLNFYPDGYSIAVKLNEFPVFTSETILETAKISYEETSLLNYIENEELPPLLVEMIDSSPKLSRYKMWHNGCLVLEVRDKTSNSGSYFILLKPTNLSMLNDVLSLTESNTWSDQDRLRLESQIVLHNSPVLFLEPDASKHQANESAGDSWSNLTPSQSTSRHKKKLPYTKLVGLRSSRSLMNYQQGRRSIDEARDQSIRLRSDNYQQSNETLPPELTLQQFLATRRDSRKASPASNLARFHRFKRHISNSKYENVTSGLTN